MTQFNTKSKFSKLVESYVQEKRINYIEAVLHLAEKHGIELQEIKKFLNSTLRNKIEAEAKALNFLQKDDELPI